MATTRKALVLLFLVVSASVGSGAVPAQATTDTYTYTAVTQSWVVPAGVTSATFLLYGGSGGSNTGGSLGGNGGGAQATIAVTPGETISINVGAAGLTPVGPIVSLGGGSPGGGYGGAGGDSFGADAHGGANGGGSSDIRQGGTTLSDRVLVAGGGGGAGGTNDTCPTCGVAAYGGDGGDVSFSGSAGSSDPDNLTLGSNFGGCGGGGATAFAGGAGGPPAATVNDLCGLYATGGSSGQLGYGGGGGTTGSGGGGGGGGGGGYYGGGGGGGGATGGFNGGGGGGGGGGSNFGPVGSTLESGVNLGDGSVSITYVVGGGNNEQPDLAIKKATAAAFIGGDVYNTTASGQVSSAKVAAGKSATFSVRVQNDADAPDEVTLFGCAGGGGFVVTYTRGASTITSEVKAGTFSTGSLDPGESIRVTLTIKAKASLAPGKKKTCLATATSSGDGTKKDAVKAVVTVK